jgi:hypothetical protein
MPLLLAVAVVVAAVAHLLQHAVDQAAVAVVGLFRVGYLFLLHA